MSIEKLEAIKIGFQQMKTDTHWSVPKRAYIGIAAPDNVMPDLAFGRVDRDALFGGKAWIWLEVRAQKRHLDESIVTVGIDFECVPFKDKLLGVHAALFIGWLQFCPTIFA